MIGCSGFGLVVSSFRNSIVNRVCFLARNTHAFQASKLPLWTSKKILISLALHVKTLTIFQVDT